MRLSVRGSSGPLPASRLVVLLRNQLLGEKSDFLLFRVLRVDTVGEFRVMSCAGGGGEEMTVLCFDLTKLFSVIFCFCPAVLPYSVSTQLFRAWPV